MRRDVSAGCLEFIDCLRVVGRGDFVLDYLLEKTAAELIDVSEIPQPLEGDEVQHRTDFYCTEISRTELPLPQGSLRRRENLGTAVAVSQGTVDKFEI